MIVWYSAQPVGSGTLISTGIGLSPGLWAAVPTLGSAAPSLGALNCSCNWVRTSPAFFSTSDSLVLSRSDSIFSDSVAR